VRCIRRHAPHETSCLGGARRTSMCAALRVCFCPRERMASQRWMGCVASGSRSLCGRCGQKRIPRAAGLTRLRACARRAPPFTKWAMTHARLRTHTRTVAIPTPESTCRRTRRSESPIPAPRANPSSGTHQLFREIRHPYPTVKHRRRHR